MALRKQRLAYFEGNDINPYPAEPPLRTAPNSMIRVRADELMQGDQQPIHSVGRITAIRAHKNFIFAVIDDGSETSQEPGTLQIVLNVNNDSDSLKIFKNGVDTGDIIRVSGLLMKTKTGELTIAVDGLAMLAKALRPPPLFRLPGQAREVGRDQRYLELINSREARDRFRIRSKIMQMMREKFMRLGNLEVQTPILDTTYGGASAKPFTTHHSALNQEMFMRISNELYLKRLVVGMLNEGKGGVFEFSTDLRNEGMDAVHHPEFTQVELYMPYRDYNFMMKMTQELYKKMAKKTTGGLKIPFGDQTIDFNNWRKISIYDGLKRNLQINPRSVSDNELQALAERYDINPNQQRGFLLLELFEKAVAPLYGPDPLFIIDYPQETSPLAKRHRKYPDLVERFELSIAGMEVGNCYTELNDPREQRARFEQEEIRRLAGDTEAQLMDEEFLIAMEHGMPPMGGIGLSVDRLTMILTNQPHIQDVILFPHRRR